MNDFLGGYGTFLGIIIGIVIGIIIIYYVIVWTLNFFYKTKFKKTYNIHIPKGFKVRRNKTEYVGDYELNYPKWLYANKNGSRNKVRKNNNLIYYPCNLYYKDFRITTKSPINMINLVHQFRGIIGDNSINKNAEEIKKYEEIKKKLELYNKNNDIQTIIDQCRDEPTKFEEFCAKLFEKMEYKVKITPKVNDGGYDLILHKDKEKSIVECKCYALRHSVGRPLIQKLVGANQTAQADKIIFVTTSFFSKEAIQYANEIKVELIDGERLINFIQKYFDNNSKNSKNINRKDWELTKNDIKKYYPPDIEI